MTKDNVIVFPTDRIVNKQKVIIDQKEVQKQYKKIEEATNNTICGNVC